jgi:hypothetical protein
MTVLEIRFYESVPRELRRLNDNLEQLIKIIDNGNNTSKRVQDADHIL